MHRRGRGGAGGPWGPKGGGWADNTKRTRVERPPGLRGKAIGMFYANRNREMRQLNKGKKEYMISFGIPQSVQNQLCINLETITKLAKRLNIPLAPIPNPFPNHRKLAMKAIEQTPEKNIDDKKSEEKIPAQGTDQFNITWELNLDKVKSDNSSLDDDDFFKKPNAPGTSSAPDFIRIGTEVPQDYDSGETTHSLRGGSHYKYSYEDIITGSFDEKLEECINKGITINKNTSDIADMNLMLYEDYQDMQTRGRYKQMMDFRRKLPAYKKRAELIDIIENNQVIVISGETGCGKSTQVPQLILDHAISNNEGAKVHILCTQPRRIAASSLAMRVAEERGEELGRSVGYAVRLEKVESRPRGSVMFVTTGILLAELEVNQALSYCSHIILDEVHERDCHIDLSMCMLKRVLAKRKELKLILMSATIDAETLSEYFDNCPMMHIEGLAYPVKDVYLEDILLMTDYKLKPKPESQMRGHRGRRGRGGRFRSMQAQSMEREIQYHAEIDNWLTELCQKNPSYNRVRPQLADPRIEDIDIELLVELVTHICKGDPGAILVFLPGIGHITKMIGLMESSGNFPRGYFDIYPLHSKLATLEQHKIFKRPPMGVRKIIIATNIAETSITIDDIVYVVDCAKIKISGLQVEDNVSTLKVEWVSQANLRQRRGRAGRCQPGICYHLLTSYRAANLAERLLPELQRSDLLEPVLMVKQLRLGFAADAMNLVPSPPAKATVDWAVKHLQKCGALNAKETLTPLGWHMARLPVHPSAGKLLILAALFGCLDRAASVAAVWGFKDPFQLVIGKEREIDECKRRFSLGEPSDHIAISEAVMQWERLPRHARYSFAYNNFLSNNTLELLYDMKDQLGNSLKQMGFLPSGDVRAKWENRNAHNLSLFKAIVAASLYPKIGTVRWVGLNKGRRPPRIKVMLPEFGEDGIRKAVMVHPSSVCSSSYKPGQEKPICDNPGANWLVYWLLQKSTDLYLIDVTLVYTLPLLFFGELTVKLLEEEKDGDECILAISSTNVRCYKSTVSILFELRALLDQVLASRVMVTSKRDTAHSDFQECVLNAVIELITAEDERADYFGDDDDSSETSEMD
ncbi:helicase associated domain (HA2) domain-containing protein [Phthorimaea operculella]|nr:helicase associated domain (HA2) domain-containing protein [Phthorimaea operculella]